MIEENEGGPAPIGVPAYRENENLLGSAFFCFKIEDTIYNNGCFQIEASSLIDTLNHEIKRFNNLVILRVFFGGLINKLFSNYINKKTFKIIFKRSNDILFSSNDFYVQKDKILFIYNIAEKYTIKIKEFENPSCPEQYDAFNKIIKDKETLFNETKNYLKENLDMELFIHLLEIEQNKIDEVFDLLEFFPSSKMKIKYNKNNSLKIINFEVFQKKKNYLKLVFIYSVIQDSINLINEIKEEDLNILFRYNEFHKESLLIIKKNIFNFFFSKTNKIEYIKKIVQYCESIPILFNYLLAIESDKLKKIKGLTIYDLPKFSYVEDNLLELIEKYEKIKEIFKENEINILWRKYLFHLYEIKSFDILEKIKEKFIEINETFYNSIIKEMNVEIIKKGKKMIIDNKFSNLEMFKFINKFNSIDDFYSDKKLVNSIGHNINLENLDKDGNVKEFNQCKFFNKISDENIQYYITGILDKINNFEEFSLFFKYIYHIKELESTESIMDKKDKLVNSLIIKYFISLINRIPEIKITKEFREILWKVIILSVRNNVYLSFLTGESYLSLVSINDQLFFLLIEEFINRLLL